MHPTRRIKPARWPGKSRRGQGLVCANHRTIPKPFRPRHVSPLRPRSSPPHPTPSMNKQPLDTALDRRPFLRSTGALVLGASLLGRASRSLGADVTTPALFSPSGKALRGLYPILQTPFTPDNKLDAEALAAEVRFCNRGRLGGMI